MNVVTTNVYPPVDITSVILDEIIAPEGRLEEKDPLEDAGLECCGKTLATTQSSRRLELTSNHKGIQFYLKKSAGDEKVDVSRTLMEETVNHQKKKKGEEYGPRGNKKSAFACPNEGCRISYAHKWRLTRHMTRCGQKPRFKCGYCDYSRFDRSVVCVHIILKHRGSEFLVIDTQDNNRKV